MEINGLTVIQGRQTGGKRFEKCILVFMPVHAQWVWSDSNVDWVTFYNNVQIC